MKRGQKSYREDWYVCMFKAVGAVEDVWYVHVPFSLFGLCMYHLVSVPSMYMVHACTF